MTKQFKHDLIYGAAWAIFRLVNALPRKAALALGRMLGGLAGVAAHRERHRAMTNLDRAYGDKLSYRRKTQIARDGFINFGRSAAEAIRFRRHFRSEILPLVEVVGEEKLKALYDRGKGIVVFTGHIGNFELLAAWVAQAGYKTAVIGRELYDKRLDDLLVANRTAMGMVNVRTDDPPMTIVRLLRDGHVIGFLIDTDSFRVTGELTPFFGRLAKTPIGPTQLGLLSGAAFVPMFCVARPGDRYRIIVGDELVPSSRERSRENVYRITCRMTEIIEGMIRQYPEQWIWMHNRWHTRPTEDDLGFLSSMNVKF